MTYGRADLSVSFLDLRMSLSAIVMEEHPSDRGWRPAPFAECIVQVRQLTRWPLRLYAKGNPSIVRLSESVLGFCSDGALPERHLVQFFEIAWVSPLDR